MVTGLEIGFGLKTLADLFKLAKEAKDLTDSSAMHAKVSAMYALILQAQSEAIESNQAHMAQIKHVGELEKQLADFETWETEKARYELKGIGDGATAYMLKPSARGSEPPHWACQNCYQDRKVKALQPNGEKPGRYRIYECPDCGASMDIRFGAPKWLD